MRFILTGGETNDVAQSDKLTAGLDGDCAIADNGRDSNRFVALIEANGMEAVITARAESQVAA